MQKLAISFILVIFTISTYCQDDFPGVAYHDLPPGYSLVDLMYRNAIATDDSNNIWVGFDRIGLGKFDGTSWTVYSVDNSDIPSDKVLCLYSENDIIYIGTDYGLAVLDNNNWTIYNTANSDICDDLIKCVYYKDGSIWVGTHNGACKFDGSSWTTYNTQNSGIVSDTINCIHRSSADEMYFGTYKGFSKARTSWTTYNSSNSGLGNDSILSLQTDNNNNLWIGTDLKGAYLLKNNEIKPLTSLFPTLYYWKYPYSVYSLMKNKKGEIFIPLIAIEGPNFYSADQSIIKITDTAFTTFTEYIFRKGYSPGSHYFSINGNLIWGVYGYPRNYIISLDLTKVEPRIINYKDFEYLDINNYKAGFHSSGQMFWDLEGRSICEVPQGSGKSTLFSGSIWLGGKDEAGKLHIAAERFRSYGQDYYSGPIMDSIWYQSENEKWSRLWKINKTEIEAHIANYQQSGYIIPEPILNWPAHGAMWKGQALNLAPFVDINNNGTYEPLSGDYPKIRGDQAVYFIFNDDKGPQGETKGEKMKIEIHAMVYGFKAKSDTALYNSFFINYRIFNRSDNNYDSVYVGNWTDLDIGSSNDDYIGCDTNLHAYFGYNGMAIDGSGRPGHYGETPPFQSVGFLNVPMSSFLYHNNDRSVRGDPDTATEYYNYMKGIWKDGTHMQYGGNGHPNSGAYGPECNFMFPGEPFDTTQWNEASSGNVPNDRRGLGVHGPFSLDKGEMKSIDLIYAYSRTATKSAGPCYYQMQSDLTTIRSYFIDNFPLDAEDLKVGIEEEKTSQSSSKLSIYPNPAKNEIIIELASSENNATAEVYSLSGKLVLNLTLTSSHNTVNISKLNNGVYFIKVQTKDGVYVGKVVVR